LHPLPWGRQLRTRLPFEAEQNIMGEGSDTQLLSAAARMLRARTDVEASMSKHHFVVTLSCTSELSGSDLMDALMAIAPGGHGTVGGAHDRDDNLVCTLCGDDGSGDEACPVETARLRDAGVL
jgi:hypothetical protein